MRWAREHGCELDEYMCSRAADGGHLAQWTRKNGRSWDWLTCLNRAIANGHVEVMMAGDSGRVGLNGNNKTRAA